MRKTPLTLLFILLLLAVVMASSLFLIDRHVQAVGRLRFLTVEEVTKMEDVDCIIVLGCRVYDNGSLSPLLRDRVLRALELYEKGAAPKLLMSGDHSRPDYDEVGAMKKYAVQNGVPSEDVFLDHAGFSTYETVYRAKEIFQAQKVIIVTQEYHLCRALYIAEKLGLEAYGVPADLNRYAGQLGRDAREILARCKDFVMCLFKPAPTYLGEAIPVDGNGDLTNG